MTKNTYQITSGTLVSGHTLSGLTVTGSQTNVGSSANTISGTEVIKDSSNNVVTSNYAVTKVAGTLTVTKATLVAPTGLAWGTGADAGKASWNAVSGIGSVTVSYTVVLKRGTTTIDTYTNITNTEKAFAEIIRTEAVSGTYTFTVQAISSNTDNVNSSAATTSGNQNVVKITVAKGTGVSGVNIGGAASYIYIAGQSSVGISATMSDGYSFTGWTQSPANATISNAANATTAVTAVSGSSDITLTATTNSVSYTITYNTDGGSTVTSLSYTVEDAITLNSTATKTGFALQGWKVTTADGNWVLNTVYDMSHLSIAAGKYGNITLTAQWNATDIYSITITVVYASNCESNAMGFVKITKSGFAIEAILIAPNGTATYTFTKLYAGTYTITAYASTNHGTSVSTGTVTVSGTTLTGSSTVTVSQTASNLFYDSTANTEATSTSAVVTAVAPQTYSAPSLTSTTKVVAQEEPMTVNETETILANEITQDAHNLNAEPTTSAKASEKGSASSANNSVEVANNNPAQAEQSENLTAESYVIEESYQIQPEEDLVNKDQIMNQDNTSTNEDGSKHGEQDDDGEEE